jgi:hypothetical protein
MKKIFVLILFMLLPAINVQAVIVTGTATTKEGAIQSAFYEAVTMFINSFVYGVTDVENFQLKKDQITAAVSGYVKNYRIIRSIKQDDVIIITLDVTVAESKIESIVREVGLVTVKDILKDHSNITQRQEQMKKLIQMLKILASRPVTEKYYISYVGYEIKKINLCK